MRVKTITCPNCGHANNFLAEECTQCGINFSRYYEELEKAETLRRHIEEQEKAETLRNEQEEKERREAEKRQRQQEEQSRIEAEELERIKEEKRLETELLREKQERAEVLKRQKEALAEAEAIQRQKEEEEEKERREAEARQQEEEAEAQRIQQEEQARLEEEARRREEEQKRLDEEKPQEEKAANPVDDTNAVEIEELETADIEEYAGAFDFIEYPADDPSDADQLDNADTLDAPPYNYRPAASLEERLRVYEGRMLGLTYGDPAEIQNVKLLAVSRDHFQVFYPISNNVVSFPYDVIMSITENAEGLSAVGPDISPVFPMVVELPRPFFHAV